MNQIAALYRSTGKHGQADDNLTTAMTMYREMGMRYWRQEVETQKLPA